MSDRKDLDRARGKLVDATFFCAEQVGINPRRLDGWMFVRLMLGREQTLANYRVPGLLTNFVDAQFPGRDIYINSVEAVVDPKRYSSLTSVNIEVKPLSATGYERQGNGLIVSPDSDAALSPNLHLRLHEGDKPFTYAHHSSSVRSVLAEGPKGRHFTKATEALDARIIEAIAAFMPDPNLMKVGPWWMERNILSYLPLMNERAFDQFINRHLRRPSREVGVIKY